MSDGQSDDATALTLDLVPHVESECGEVADLSLSLSDFGTTQAERLGEAYLDRDIGDFNVNPFVRARESVCPIAKGLGREPEVIEWTRELDLASMTGAVGGDQSLLQTRYRARDLAD